MSESLGDAVLKLRTDDKDFNRGLSTAEKKTQDLNKSLEASEARAVALGQAMTAAAVAGIAALAKLTSEAVRLADVQIQAEQRLGAAVRLTGGDAAAAVKEFKEFAAQLQNVTTVGDETSLGMLQVATSMGLTASQAKVAVQEAIGLGKAFGISERSAIRYTASLAAGDTTMLNRYIPSLRMVKDDAERVAKAHELLGNAFGVAKEEALAGLGPWRQLQNATGDLLEIMGKAVIEGIEPLAKGLLSLAQSEDAKIFFEGLGVTIGQVAKAASTLAEILTRGLSEILRGYGQAFLSLFNALDRIPPAMRVLVPGFDDLQKGALTTAGIFTDLHETLGNAADAFGGLGKPVKDLTTGLGSSTTGLGGALADVRHEFEETITVVDRATSSLELYLGILNDLIKQQRQFDGMEPLPLATGLPSQIPLLPTNEETEALTGQFEEVGEQVTIILSNAIGDALTGDGGVNYEQLGAALGAVIGNAIAPGVGGAIGSVFGAMFGGFFEGGNQNRDMRSLGQKLTDLAAGVTSLLHEVNPLLGETDALFNRLNLLLKEAHDIGEDFGAVLDAAKVKIEDLRDSILGIKVDDFANRLLAALQLNAGLGVSDLTPGGTIKGGTGGGGGPDGSGVGQVPIAFDAVTESAMRFTSVLGEQSERYDVVGINLSAFSSQLISEFAGVTAAVDLMSINATAEALREAILELEELGIATEDTAFLLRELADAQALLVSELESDALQRLADHIRQIPAAQEEAARLQQQINQARFQVETALIEMQLNALGLMTEAFAAMLDMARVFGADIGNFSVPNVRLGGGIGGGRRRGGGRSGPSRADQRESLLEEWERFLRSGRDAHSFANELRDLRDAFFGPGGFQERFRELGLSTREMAAEFARMRDQIVQRANAPLRDVLRDLQLGTGGFGGASLSQQFFAQGAEFRRLAGLASRDLDQRGPLAEVARSYIESIQRMFGGSRRGQALIDEVRGTIGGILGPDGLEDPAIVLDRDRNNVLYDIRELLGGEGREREEQILASSLDQVSLLSKAHNQRNRQERKLSEVADELRAARRDRNRKSWVPTRAEAAMISTGRP
jgi:hypothetical protein